jgi:AraC family transcriptional regulator
MTPSRFETGRPMLLAGLRRWYAFSEGPTEIPVVWNEFVTRLPLPGQVGGMTYGATCQADMPGERFEYMCAAEVESFDALPDDLGRLRVPEAYYAVFTHDAPVWKIRETIMGSQAWLGSNGEWKDAETPGFERYGPRFDAATGMGDTEIWVPVTRP